MKIGDVFKKIVVVALAVMFGAVYVACSSYGGGGGYWGGNDAFVQGDEFTQFDENQFVKTLDAPVSYFSMDVSTASYSTIRNYINKGLSIDKNMVKIEEMINYFNYDYESPTDEAPLKMNGNIFPCAWNEDSQLLSVGIKAKDIEFESVKNNLVFLIDVSGSMDSSDKLGLLQQAFCILADNLNDDDVVSIVTYAGNSATALDGAKGADRVRIKNIITDLVAGGSTGGEGGIRRAYELAEKHYIAGGNNRVILATDGDFNVGISSQSKLKSFISDKRSQSKGVYLSVMGFGLGNLKNNTMDTLAQNGNGAAYYIDSPLEAKKVMTTEMKGTLVTVADDVKASVEFNSDRVESYRLLGYETKLLTQEDWENEDADAGEIGAGHTVTALYEIKLKAGAASGEYAKAAVRYKEPFKGDVPKEDSRQVKEIILVLDDGKVLSTEQLESNEDLMFMSSVVEAALIFSNSMFKADANLDNVIERLQNLNSVTTNEYRADFLQMLLIYKNKQ